MEIDNLNVLLHECYGDFLRNPVLGEPLNEAEFPTLPVLDKELASSEIKFTMKRFNEVKIPLRKFALHVGRTGEIVKIITRQNSPFYFDTDVTKVPVAVFQTSDITMRLNEVEFNNYRFLGQTGCNKLIQLTDNVAELLTIDPDIIDGLKCPTCGTHHKFPLNEFIFI